MLADGARSRDVLWVPIYSAEQRSCRREKGEDCLRAQPEFRSPRRQRVAQGSRRKPTA